MRTGYLPTKPKRIPTTFTDAELAALPIAPDRYETLTDPATGYAYHVRLPQQFLVNDTEFAFFTDANGDSWTVGRTSEGAYFKSRFNL